MKNAIATIVLLAATTSRTALADEPVTTLDRVCAEIDTDQDQLAEPERAVAKKVLQRVLEEANLLVVDDQCSETFRASHERASGKLVIHLRGPRGLRRRAGVASLEKVPDMYRRMVAALLQDLAAKATVAAVPATPSNDTELAPVSEPAPAVATAPDNDEPTASSQAEPEAAPPAADHDASEPTPEAPGARPTGLFYARVGKGSIAGSSGTAGSLGYRYETGNLGLDVSLDFGGGGGASQIKAAGRALYIPRPEQSGSVYFGAGLSIGTATIPVAPPAVESMQHGDGWNFEAVAGYELPRSPSSPLRLFGELQLSQAMYSISDMYTDVSPTTFIVAVGVGVPR